MKKLIYFFVFCACAWSVQAFTDAEKTAVRQAVDLVAAQFKTAAALNGKALTVLPVRGDENAFAEDLLVGALVRNGKTVVISDDHEKDARFRAILKEIRWDERGTTLKMIDPATVDQLGQLKSTQVFLEAKLDFDRTKRRPGASIGILAYAVGTKQYVWSAYFAPPRDRDHALPQVFVRPAKTPLNVAVEMKGNLSAVASDVAILLRSSILAENLGVLNGKVAPEAIVTLETAFSTFDTTGSWIVLDGTTHVVVRTTAGEKPSRIGEVEFSARSARSLGKPAAEKALAKALDAQVSAWVKKVLASTTIDVEAVEFALERGEAVEQAGDVAASEAVRKALAAMSGVRSVTLVAQDNAKGAFTYRAVYEKAKYPGGFMNAAYEAHKDLFKPFEKK